ncbi:unnamed protein product [Angiostrongylus costaricensis]|uniref:KIF21A/B second helical domain-containing protein n=1 Tax=Angiostrongylus costaricensis TaxID=334426 RepID=A0A158PLL6_ANGCS|nr:unnamed protein product [Angiostrongylus costaricensis]
MLRVLLTTTSDGPSRPAAIQSAFRPVLPGELAEHAVSNGTKAVTNYILLDKNSAYFVILLISRNTFSFILDHHPAERRFVSISEIDEREAVADEIDGCEQKLKYVQDQIAETQTAIVDMDRPDKVMFHFHSMLTVQCFPFALSELAGTTNGAQILLIVRKGVIEHCSNLVEAKYLMQHLFSACIDHAVAAARADSQNKESEARIQQLEQQSFISEQLLSTVIADKDLINDVEGMLEQNLQKNCTPSSASLRNGSVSPNRTDSSEPLPHRIRRHTASADELLYPADTVEPANLKEFDNTDVAEENRDKKRKVWVFLGAPKKGHLFSKNAA